MSVIKAVKFTLMGQRGVHIEHLLLYNVKNKA